MTRAPRNGDDALGAALGVTPRTAKGIRKRMGAGDSFTDLDARLRADSALSDLEAARSVDSDDIEWAAEQDEPVIALAEQIDRRSERSMRAKLAAHTSWGNTVNRTSRTAPARKALDEKFLREAEGDPVRAEHIRKAYYLRLALKSAQVRRQKRDAKP